MKNSISKNGQETIRVTIPAHMMAELQSEAAQRGCSIETAIHDIVTKFASR